LQKIVQGVIPDSWRTPFPLSSSIDTFMNDFILCADQLKMAKQYIEDRTLVDFVRGGIKLGLLSNPEGFITATRQVAVRENHNWSLENITLKLVTNSGKGSKIGQGFFVLKGLVLQGAGWEDYKLLPSPLMEMELSPLTFTWDNIDTVTPNDTKYISVPVFLNEKRKSFLFSVNVNYEGKLQKLDWIKRGLAIVAHKLQ